tara:strand:+ start:1046 stop:1423 length:378 start_codon:yes stop_codon:yes gene_type:complete
MPKTNKLKTIGDIKKAYPLFFSYSSMDAFKSRVYDSVKVTELGTYFITSEIFKYERIGEHEVIHHERDRTFFVRFADDNNIYRIQECETLHMAEMYLDRLNHDTGGFRVSQHEANQAKLRILGVK